MPKILAFVIALIAVTISMALSAPAYDEAAVARIHAGIVDCPSCNLQSADLTNTCVKAKNLMGANFDGAKAVLMCMSYANFSRATFRGTDLSGANLAHAILDDADLTGAVMAITSLKGTDLTRVKGLDQKQLDQACGDADTKVPAGMKVHFCSLIRSRISGALRARTRCGFSLLGNNSSPRPRMYRTGVFFYSAACGSSFSFQRRTGFLAAAVSSRRRRGA
jgi:hypothetical protein